MYAGATTAIFIWSMGVTMHRHGVDNVKAIANLALVRGNVGRPKTGLMAIRGHSGVQGGAEMGCVPNQYPGGFPVGEDGARHLEALWAFQVPAWKGYFITEMVDAAFRGEIDVLYCVGSNLLRVLPDSHYVRKALERIPLRIHHDIVLNPQMLVAPAETVLILPATTRYEMVGGGTETSTERRVIFNPEIPGPRIAAARDEWRVLMELAKRVKPDLADKIQFDSTAAIRQEIARVIPLYEGIQLFREKGDQFQWGGPLLARNGRFGFPDGRGALFRGRPPTAQNSSRTFSVHHETRQTVQQYDRSASCRVSAFGKKDMLVGTVRDDVLLSPEDMERLKLKEGDPVTVRSETGEFRGHSEKGPIQPGTVMMYWPEANVLTTRGVADPECGIPAYRDAIVQVIAT